ncbi:MAG TPA: RNA methyltransferase [Schlesneria sp.]|jgi:tRNA G18 (ribose-2'-O)-methylase SpoU
MPRIAIESLDDPRVQMYRHLKSSNLLRDGRLFIAEGTKLVERMLASDYQTESVLIAEKREAEWGPKVPPEIPLYVIPQEVGEQLTGFNFHVGVLACGVRQPARTIDEVVPRQVERLTVAICPNCDNPENLGTIIRIGSAFGIDALLLGRSCCDPFSRRVLRVSMGTAFRLPIVESIDLERDVLRLREEWNLELIATVLDDNASSLSSADRGSRVGLLFGNEADGLDQQWQSLCHRRLTIPMRGGTDSLNVAIAAGIFLHHFTS